VVEPTSLRRGFVGTGETDVDDTLVVTARGRTPPRSVRALPSKKLPGICFSIEREVVGQPAPERSQALWQLLPVRLESRSPPDSSSMPASARTCFAGAGRPCYVE
jgi:hypothetical protein